MTVDHRIEPEGGAGRDPASDPPVERRGGVGRTVAERSRALLGVGGFVLLFGAWQLAASTGLVNPLFTSSPLGVLAAAADYLPTAQFAEDLAVSAAGLFGGLGLAIAVGLTVGLLMGWYDWLFQLLDPLTSFLYSLPRIAFIPLFIIWFGIGVSSKVALIFVMAVFPIIINTTTGVRSVDRDLLDMARSFTATGLGLFRTVVLPSATPSILAGIRVAVGLGLIGVAVGELFSSRAGIGHMIAQSSAAFQTDRVFLGTIILGLFGIAFSQLLRLLERRAERWRPSLRG
ncbi:ABC transporter permease [Pseudonocardia kongjuensis]|uniref:ABC transporter permease n=1 Tax=Pseudonocardia kongjuensis TaxID=102227 RepID=UPI0031D2E72B